MTHHNSVCVEELRWDRERKQEGGNGGQRKERGIWKEGGSQERMSQAWTEWAAGATVTGHQRMANAQSYRTNEVFGRAAFTPGLNIRGCAFYPRW